MNLLIIECTTVCLCAIGFLGCAYFKSDKSRAASLIIGTIAFYGFLGINFFLLPPESTHFLPGFLVISPAVYLFLFKEMKKKAKSLGVTVWQYLKYTEMEFPIPEKRVKS